MKKILFFLTCITLLAQGEALKDIYFGDAVVSEVTSIYDGDTFRANIKGFPPIVGYRMSIRVNGIDTPELKARCKKEKALALKAKQITVKALRKAKIIELRNYKRGKYFRLVADVYVDDVRLADKLIDAHLAVEYHGGTKTKDWCK